MYTDKPCKKELIRVLHVTPSFYPAMVYGGPTVSVHQLCLGLVRQGCEVRVLTTDANGPDAELEVDTGQEVEITGGVLVRYCHRVMDVSISPALLRLLTPAIRWADVVHLMAVYSFPTIPTLLACNLLRKPVVWSSRGMLQRWEGTKRRRAKAVWEFMCRAVSPERTILHVTSKEEAVESRKRLPAVRTVVVPNGVPIPTAVSHVDGHHGLRLAYLGRLDPKKGIENLLAACRLLNGSLGASFSLTIAGTGDPRYAQSLQVRIGQLALRQHVKLIGSVTGEAKRSLFENADVVVVPSHTENYGLVVAEALAHGVPVIASHGTPWKGVEEVGCGLWVQNTPVALAAAIQRVSRMPLCEMGHRGRAWMQKEFAWDLVARQMVDVYRDVLRRSA